MSVILRGYIAKRFDMLRETLLERLPDQGSYAAGIPGLCLHKFENDNHPVPVLNNPALVLVVQGKNAIQIGTKEVTCEDRGCFVTGIRPVFCLLKEASPTKPYLALTIALDHSLLTRLSWLTDSCKSSVGLTLPAVQACTLDDVLLDACFRLLKLASTPEQIPFLAPLCWVEIHYRLLFDLLASKAQVLYPNKK